LPAAKLYFTEDDEAPNSLVGRYRSMRGFELSKRKLAKGKL